MAIKAETLEAEVKVTGAAKAKSELAGVGKAGDLAGRGVEAGGVRAARGGKKFNAVGLLVKAAGATMVASIGKKVVMAASDLNEELSKTGVVFGPRAKGVEKAADGMAKKFGIVKQEFLQSASGLGLIAKASGLNQREAAKLSVKFGKLGADAASFYNVPMADALADIKSGLVGEAEPMRKYGVLLNEAAVKAEAVRLGIAKTTDELTEGQKVQARSSLIMKGMSDASGDLARTQGSVANRIREAQGRITNYAAEIGQKALPVVADFLGWFSTKGMAGLEDFGQTFKDDLLPPLKDLVQMGGSVLSFLNGLPGPLKSGALQAGLFAFGLSKILPVTDSLRTRASTLSATLATSTGRMDAVRKASYAMGQGLRMAAGAGGMMLLVNSAGKAGTAMGTFERTAGAALLGFSVGGPWGAAVGAMVGYLTSASGATNKTAEGFRAARKAATDFTAALEASNGAIDSNVRKQALLSLQNRHLIDDGKNIGVAARDMVGAMLGQGDATKRVTKAIMDSRAAYDAATAGGKQATAAQAQMLTSSEALRVAIFGASGVMGEFGKQGVGLRQEFKRQQETIQRNISDVKTWKEVLRGIPPKAQTELKALGADATRKEVRALGKELGLTPKQVRIAMKAFGFIPATKDAQKAKRAISDLDKATANPKARLTDDTKMTAKQIRARIRELDMTKADPKARLVDKASNPIRLLTRGLGTLNRTTAKPGAILRDQASAKIAEVERRLSALNGKTAFTTAVTILRTTQQKWTGGFVESFAKGGFTGAGGKYQPMGTVHGGEFVMDKETTTRIRPILEAIHATKGRILESLGGFAKGGAVGKGKAKGKVAAIPGAKYVQNLAESIKAGSIGGIEAAAKVMAQRLSGAQEKAWNKSLTKMVAYSKERIGLAMRIQAATASRDTQVEAKNSAREAITQGITSQANVLNAGNSVQAINASLGTQLAKAKEFSKNLQELRRMGYSSAILEQVGSAGIEGGAEVAKALLAGSKAEVSQMNASFAGITNIGKATGTQLAGQMYDAGIQAANGLIAGLTKRQKAIEAYMAKVAQGMEKALKKALKIKSPSRVTAQIGGYVGQGLIDGMAGKRQGTLQASRNLARSAIRGLGDLEGVGTVGAPQIGARVLTPAAMGGGAAPSNVHLEFKTYNPVAEPQSRTTNKALDRVAAVGLVG